MTHQEVLDKIEAKKKGRVPKVEERIEELKKWIDSGIEEVVEYELLGNENCAKSSMYFIEGWRKELNKLEGGNK